ncbi:WD40 repeat-like protein, partial [Amniculicola lignicola CBS 123094]
MAKRKRDAAESAAVGTVVKSRKEEVSSLPARPAVPASKAAAKKQVTIAQVKVNGKASAKPVSATKDTSAEPLTVQIITGSYERVLHGFTATLPQSLVTGPGSGLGPGLQDGEKEKEKEKEKEQSPISFSDTFLFNAHASSIRCLALSPPSIETSKILLATGSTDERINIYSLSTCPPPPPSKLTPLLPSLNGTSITENAKNKELGTLLHHSSSITALYFPSRSKLLSAAEDSTISIIRAKDWVPLSSIKAPIPTPLGRPSGDTAAPGEVPSGINAFAVHPSNKLMVSVSKGEKSMRLWNLVTGKKAGVLNFGRDILGAVGEGRFGTGEGRRIVWDAEGDEYVVAFERGAVVFGLDSKPRARIAPTPRTKLHQMHYWPGSTGLNILAVSTEDGRVLFYNTTATMSLEDGTKKDDIPPCRLVAQLGGPAAGISGRVKDFEILLLSVASGDDAASTSNSAPYLIITGSSDGSVRLWLLSAQDLAPAPVPALDSADAPGEGFSTKEVGTLVGTYTIGTRITCMRAFVMTGVADVIDDEEDEGKEG